MSGVAGASRIQSRADFEQFLHSYNKLMQGFPGFESVRPSGSYNSDLHKDNFGDIDLITHISSDQDKATVKKQLAAYLTAQPETVIVPFSNPKYVGRRFYNSGEIITVRFYDPKLGYSVQVDNIIALTPTEAEFKQSFLDFPAETQGLVLGLVKVAMLENDPAELLARLSIEPVPVGANQELEFNLSSAELQLRRVTYAPNSYTQTGREIVWRSNSRVDLDKLLSQYDLSQSFEQLLAQAQRTIQNPRSSRRIAGVFASMVSVKSGEEGTPKAERKQYALNRVRSVFGESTVSIGAVAHSLFEERYRL